jgi:hypothetical protein
MATTKKTATKTSRRPRTVKSVAKPRNTSNIKTETKTEIAVRMLRGRDGASLAELLEALGWLQHSVRALLSARIAKELKLPLVKNRRPGEETRYHIGALRSGKE